MPVLHWLLYFVICFEIRKCESSKFVLLFQDCLGFLKFYMNLKIKFSIPIKNMIGILIRIELIYNLDTTEIWTILCLPIHEHGLWFHLSVFFHFFQQCFIFIVQIFNTSVYFLFSHSFDAIIKKIVLIISFPDYSWLKYRNTIDFCMLALYSENLLDSFFNSNSCFCRTFKVSTYKINSLVLSLLYDPTLTPIHDYWKNHSFDNTDFCWQSDIYAF